MGKEDCIEAGGIVKLGNGWGTRSLKRELQRNRDLKAGRCKVKEGMTKYQMLRKRLKTAFSNKVFFCLP